MANFLLQQLFQSLPPKERPYVLREAGLPDIGSAIFEGSQAERLLQAIMRVLPLSNEAFADIVREAEMIPESDISAPKKDGLKEVTAAFVFASDEPGTDLRISDVVASSGISWEVAARVAGVYRELSAVKSLEPPPRVRIASGSVQIVFAWSAIAAGTALIMETPPPDEGQSVRRTGQVVVALGSILELTRDWERMVARAIRQDPSQQLADLNREFVLAAGKRPRSQFKKNKSGPSEGSPPVSRMPNEMISYLSERFGVPPLIAMQLINQISDSFHALKQLAGSPSVTISTSGGTQASASAGA